jgi:hypothetical protein
MRRAVVLAAIVGVALAAPVLPDGPVTGHLPPAGTAPEASTKTIQYGGLRLRVPAGWPVYHLDREPARCVRFDRHAVYLGRPGTDQDCPARLVGRTEALLIEPLQPDLGPVTGSLGRHLRTVRTSPRRSPSLARYIVPLTVERQVRVPLADAGVAITATYGAGREVVQRLLRDSARTPWWPSPGLSAAPGSPAPPDVALSPIMPEGAGEPVSRTLGEARLEARPEMPPEAAPGMWDAAGSAAVDEAAPDGVPDGLGEGVGEGVGGSVGGSVGERAGRRRPWATGRGFDTCTAPSLRAMRAWHRTYPITNIYIGGAARGCGQPNLTRNWMRSVRRMGYRFIPTYVGLQAPCNKRYRDGFGIERPGLEGRLSADDAVRRARALGIGRKAPIYFDMEAYDSRKAKCRDVVLRFLHEWSRRLRQRGYRPGVYSSVASGIRDLGLAEGITKPKAIWFAHWDGKARTHGSRYLPDSWWYPHRRIKQYRGGHKEKHGGVTINVDSNFVDGLVH